jgi:hypothetical protein
MSDPLDFSAFEAQALRPRSSSLNIRFEKTLRINPAKTAEAGHPVHDEVDIAFLNVPGSRDEVPAKIDDKFLAQHGAAYERWKATQEQPLDGLALEMWPPIPKNLVEDWKYFKVRTVQQLATLDDSKIQALGMGAREWQKKAKVWLEQAADHAASQRLVSENEQLRLEVNSLKAQVADLAAKASAVPAPAPVPAVDPAMIQKMIADALAAQKPNGAAA